MTFKKQKNFGFTLVETLVAIAILSLSVMAASAAVQSGLATSYYARDEVTAYYLIQEAVEYFRNIRDQNALANIASISTGGPGVNWLTKISLNAVDPCYFGSYCAIDIPSGIQFTCSSPFIGGGCPYLNQDSSTGLFNYLSGTKTKFKRTIKISQVNSNEIILTVTVNWTDNANKNASVSVQEWLLNTR